MTKFVVLGCAVEHVERAQVVYQPREHGFLRVDPGQLSADDMGGAGGVERVIPQPPAEFVVLDHAPGARQLLAGDGQGDGPGVPGADPFDGAFQVARRLPGGVALGGVGQSHQPRGDQGFHAHQSGKLSGIQVGGVRQGFSQALEQVVQGEQALLSLSAQSAQRDSQA